MQTFPSIAQRFVNAAGIVLQPFIGYLQQFTIAPPAFVDITIGASPFDYEAQEPGFVRIRGGTISNISLIRGSRTLLFFSSGSDTEPRIVPVAVGDIVRTTYTVAPTFILFIPSYGQNTTS